MTKRMVTRSGKIRPADAGVTIGKAGMSAVEAVKQKLAKTKAEGDAAVIRKNPFLKRNTLLESEVNLIKRRLNHGDLRLMAVFHDNTPEFGYKLTPEQNKKGLDFLMLQWKTARGVERKENPFRYREQRALATFKEFRLVDWFDDVNYYQSKAGIHNLQPVYDVHAREGSFQYYYSGGKVHIIG